MGSFNPRLPGGRRPDGRRTAGDGRKFQSTPSGGKATLCPNGPVRPVSVSIHAFRGEGDTHVARARFEDIQFQSTPSGGKATMPPALHDWIVTFQSTPSGGKATKIHADAIVVLTEFQSTPSGGKATRHLPYAPRDLDVSIHAFRGEGDQAGRRLQSLARVSIHAFRGEGDSTSVASDSK